jgi:hypothetical protein
MYPRTLAKRSALRIAFALTVFASLLLTATTPWLGSSAAQNAGHGAGRAGIKLVTHELAHVKQYRLHGAIGFGAQYGREFAANKRQGMTDEEAYREISFERDAAEYATNVTEAIGKQYGDYPCDKYKP